MNQIEVVSPEMPLFKSHHRRAIYSLRTGETSRTASRSSKTRCPSLQGHAIHPRFATIPSPVIRYLINDFGKIVDKIPDSLPTSPRPRCKPPHVEPTLIKVKRHLPSCQSGFVKKATIHNSLRSVKQTAVICNILFPVFSQSYFPALFFFGILSRASSFSFFFKYCLSVFHSVASSRQLDDFTLVQQPVK